jgi:hypothetical protein
MDTREKLDSHRCEEEEGFQNEAVVRGRKKRKGHAKKDPNRPQKLRKSRRTAHLTTKQQARKWRLISCTTFPNLS